MVFLVLFIHLFYREVWNLDVFLLDSFQELFFRALSTDPDLLRDRSFVDWWDLCSHFQVLSKGGNVLDGVVTRLPLF